VKYFFHFKLHQEAALPPLPDGVTVEYLLNGTQIVAEKNGDHIIRFQG